ncbi:translation initiation factor IF-2-like isoform X2 [Amphibalanus amphitrite]|uniref:translation initiation factor IF-2-like isoform X2 n=1 Tax=Amphibalanus amphitrite TaxID=1232801 RepID=UPI001C90436F|nr:translation initiation factor IF-2-like isoform X2 [Amphibalanus amphitrite]
MWRQMEPSWDVSRYEKFVLDLQTPPPIQPRAQMSVEDQHEWLEARRVTLMAHMELALAAHDAVPQGLLDEWCRLQRARDTLLRHRICRVSRRQGHPATTQDLSGQLAAVPARAGPAGAPAARAAALDRLRLVGRAAAGPAQLRLAAGGREAARLRVPQPPLAASALPAGHGAPVGIPSAALHAAATEWPRGPVQLTRPLTGPRTLTTDSHPVPGLSPRSGQVTDLLPGGGSRPEETGHCSRDRPGVSDPPGDPGALADLP